MNHILASACLFILASHSLAFAGEIVPSEQKSLVELSTSDTPQSTTDAKKDLEEAAADFPRLFGKEITKDEHRLGLRQYKI